jgi:hypothetical protein
LSRTEGHDGGADATDHLDLYTCPMLYNYKMLFQQGQDASFSGYGGFNRAGTIREPFDSYKEGEAI